MLAPQKDMSSRRQIGKRRGSGLLRRILAILLVFAAFAAVFVVVHATRKGTPLPEKAHRRAKGPISSAKRPAKAIDNSTGNRTSVSNVALDAAGTAPREPQATVTNVIERYGMKIMIAPDGTRHAVARETEYLSGTDQMVAMATGVPIGTEPPPLPLSFSEDGGVKEFLDGLENEIASKDDDSVETLERKIQLAQAKLEMLQLVKAGETPEKVIRDLYEERKAAAALRNEIMEDIHDWIIEQHPDDALLDMALGKFNKQLSDNGIPPLAKDDVLPEEGAETFKASREKAKNEEAGKEVPQ